MIARLPHRNTLLTGLAAVAVSVFAGCQQGGPFGQLGAGGSAAPGPAAAPPNWQQQQQQYAAQMQEFQRRAGALDANNSQLHQELAAAQKQLLVMQDEVNLLRQRLGDTANQLIAARQEKQDAQKRIEVLEASTRARGGAVIRPNSSLTAALPDFQEPGVFVRQDNDVVRVELSADRLFQPGTANLTQQGVTLIDKIAADLAQRYPGKQMGVEGHTADGVRTAGSTGVTAAQAHQLSASQALMVFQRLTAQPGIAAERLYLTGHGGNHPVVSNGTPEGQARNRRVEVVVYPDGA